MLDGARVLVVEDELVLALDLAAEVEAAGGAVVGPYATVAAALRALESAEFAAAILDANLADRDVTPVAVLLVARNIPIVVHTGVGLPADLYRIHPNLPVVLKPAPAGEVMGALEKEIALKRNGRT